MNNLKIQFKNLISKTAENNAKSLKGKLIYGIFWNFISAVASQGFPMIASIITARLLGTFGYGQLGMINSTIILFSTFAGLGLGITATKYVSQFHQTDPERTGRIMGLTNLFGIISGTLMCAILYIFAPWLATNLLAAPGLATELRIVSFLLIFNTLIGIQSGTIAGFGAFKNLARIAIIQGIISSTLIIIGVYFFGLIGALTALVINSVINLILYRISIRNLVKEFKIKIDYLKSWKEKKIIFKLSFPTMLSSVMVGPVVWIVNTIIINTPSGYAQLGIFTAADQWRSMLAFLPAVIGTVLLPLLSSTQEKSETLETINLFAGWIIVICIALPLISFPEIISFLYGNNFNSSIFIDVFVLMIIVSCIISYQEGIARKLIVKNLMWWGSLDNLLWAIILVISVIFLKNLGALGLASAYIIAYVIKTLIFVPFYLWKDVIPSNLLISKEIFIIWAILSFQAIITILNFSIFVRLISLIFSLGLIYLSFHSKWDTLRRIKPV